LQGIDGDALDYALNRALDAYYNDRQWFHSLQKRVMLQVGARKFICHAWRSILLHGVEYCVPIVQDWSWNKPAHDYIELYYAALKR
jgi:starch synthase